VDKKRDIRPFNFDAGYTLALLLEFPGSVLGLTEKSGLDTAIADDGADLMPATSFARRFHFPKLTTDRTGALIEIQMKPPASGVKGLKELSGHLQYSVAGSTKEIDLGFNTLKGAATGTELGAEIQSVTGGWKKDGSEELQLKLKLPADTIKAMWLVAGNERSELSRRGHSSSGNSSVITYEHKTAIPSTGRLVAEVYSDRKLFDATFKLENISLLGTPQ
jgi:hypothetical protein